MSSKMVDRYGVETLSVDRPDDHLGHERFAMVDYDIGMWSGFLIVIEAPQRISRIALGEAAIPSFAESPPLLSDDRWTSNLLWHLYFNRVHSVIERLAGGREDIFFGHQFTTRLA